MKYLYFKTFHKNKKNLNLLKIQFFEKNSDLLQFS